MGKNNNFGLILLGLGLFYFISKNGKKKPNGNGIGRSAYITSYAPYVQAPQYVADEPISMETVEGSNIPTALKGFKTPAQAIKYAPSGAGVKLHAGYEIR